MTGVVCDSRIFNPPNFIQDDTQELIVVLYVICLVPRSQAATKRCEDGDKRLGDEQVINRIGGERKNTKQIRQRVDIYL